MNCENDFHLKKIVPFFKLIECSTKTVTQVTFFRHSGSTLLEPLSRIVHFTKTGVIGKTEIYVCVFGWGDFHKL